MKRCPITHSDGRQCCGPEHGPGIKHLIASYPMTAEAGIRIAEAWGLTGRNAISAVAGAMSNGPISPDKFAAMNEAFSSAMSDIKR